MNIGTENPAMVELATWRETSLVRKVHAVNARVLAVFLIFHLANHLFFVVGPFYHIAVMETFRNVYRFLPVELVLYVLFLIQIGAGLWLAKLNWRPDSNWAWAQVVSGLLIAFFLLQHIFATIFVRYQFEFVDTNAWWALSVVTPPALAAYFVPYYFTGVTAVFVHLASALHFKGVKAAISIAYAAPFVAALIVGAMVYHAQTSQLPDAYQQYLKEIYGT